LAGRGTDIKLGGNPEFRAIRRAGSEASDAELKAAQELEYLSWKNDYEEVKRLGGLYVIGTERHESRRIDNQLRGRSGRQGDPGKSVFFISLDDDLMRLFGGESFKGMMSKVGMKPGEPIYHPLLNRTIESAQKKVEERNFEIRKHLLEYDDVLNKQRAFIYEQRNAILKDESLIDRVRETSSDMLASLVADAGAKFKDNRKTVPTEISIALRDTFGIDIAPNQVSRLLESSTHAQEPESSELYIAAQRSMKTDLDAKQAAAGQSNLNLFIRFHYLQEIDNKWLDHLDNMEALREAVHLRSYAQKNPLLEYKLEGSDIFENLVDAIRNSIASRVLRVTIKADESRSEPARAAIPTVTDHQSASPFAGAGRGSGMQQSSQIEKSSAPENATVVRSGEKVGRNDPCPCGSGKKYKHCHGA
jgi:preprotein translocase subunit SecA